MNEDKGTGNNANDADGVPAFPNPKDNNAKEPQDSKKQSTHAKKEPDESLRAHWRKAQPLTKVELFIAATVAVAGILTCVYYLFSYLQTQRNFATDHRPKVIFSRPPELIGTIRCQVTDKAVQYQIGAMNIWVKNIGHGDASRAFIVPEPSLVQENHIGVPGLIGIPPIDDKTCKQQLSPLSKMVPVNGGQEVTIGVRGASAAQSLGDAKQSTIFQLYLPICALYADDDGTSHGSCQTYRMAVDGQPEGSEVFSFSCPQTPIHGKFEQIFSGYCQN